MSFHNFLRKYIYFLTCGWKSSKAITLAGGLQFKQKIYCRKEAWKKRAFRWLQPVPARYQLSAITHLLDLKSQKLGARPIFFRELILPIKMNPLKEEMLFWCYILFSNYYIIVSDVKSEVVWHVLMLQGNWDGTKSDMMKVKVYVRVVVTKMQRCKTLLFCDFFLLLLFVFESRNYHLKVM